MKKSQVTVLIGKAYRVMVEFGETLGMNQEEAETVAKKELNAAIDYAERDMGLYFDSPMGTMYLNRNSPVSEEEKVTFELLRGAATLWASQNVRDDDVLWLWDLSMIERAIELKMVNVLRYACYLNYLKNHVHASLEDGQKNAGAEVARVCPSFDLLHPKYFVNTRCAPLPYELIYVVINWYMAHFKSLGGFEGISELVGQDDCLNGIARDALAAGSMVRP